jgi:hypothetical protein
MFPTAHLISPGIASGAVTIPNPVLFWAALGAPMVVAALLIVRAILRERYKSGLAFGFGSEWNHAVLSSARASARLVKNTFLFRSKQPAVARTKF